MGNSKLSFEQVVSSGTQTDQQSKALALVRKFPYRTTRELASKVNDNIISHEALHKRLPELRKLGVVSNGMSRSCAITGKKAQIWIPVESLF